MAQITDLTPATSVKDGDQLILRQDGEDKRLDAGVLEGDLNDKQTNMLTGNKGFLKGTSTSIIGKTFTNEQHVQIKDYPVTGMDSFYRVIPYKSGRVEAINLTLSTITIGGTVSSLEDYSVPEIKVASEAEAVSGIDNTKMMTPLMTKKAAEFNVPNLEYSIHQALIERSNKQRFEDLSINVKDFGAKGDGVTDDTAAIKGAISFTSLLTYGGTILFPEGEYLVTDTLNFPYKVNVLGLSKGSRSSTNEQSGAVIIKAHNKDAVVLDRDVASTQKIENILIEGHHASNTAGKGFVIQTQGPVILKSCSVYAMHDTCFHVGGGGNFTYATEFIDCYVNTYKDTPYAFYIDSIDFRGTKLLSDGAVTSFKATSDGDNWSLGNSRFEGFSHSGMRLSNQQGTTWGRVHIAGTDALALYGIILEDHAGAMDLDYCIVDRSDIKTAGSVGIWTKDLSNGNNFSKGAISSYETGILDESNAPSARNSIRDTIVGNCYKGIVANSINSRYSNVSFSTTENTCIEHKGGSGGVWIENKFDLLGDAAIRPTFSKQSGNFNNTVVRNNIGYITRNSGYISSITSGSTIAHGLSAAPLQNGSVITVTPTSGGVTSAIAVQGPNSTTFKVIWTGTTNIGVRWEARLLCDS